MLATTKCSAEPNPAGGKNNFNPMDIKNAKYEISSPTVAKCPETSVPEYAFIGRSNVGKSSLINMLCKSKKMAKTSQTPGKTLLINHFRMDNGEWYIVDLPGYGFAARGKSQRDQLARMIKGYILGREQLTNLFVLLDIRHEPQKIDMEFLDWLGEHGVPFSIVFTKADKISKAAGEKNVAHYKKELLKKWEELPPIFITSSEKSQGRDALLDYIYTINKSLSQCQPKEQEEAPDPSPSTEASDHSDPSPSGEARLLR